MSLDNPNDESLIRFSFDETNSEFGLDSFASKHTCNVISMFIPESLVTLTNVGTGVIGGVSPIEKKGKIRLQITNG